MSKLSKMFDYNSKKTGIVLGETLFNVYRPNYTAPNQLGTLITTSGPRTFRVDTQASKFMEPVIPGVLAFDVFGDRKLVEIGDILLPYPSSITTTPPITICQMQAFKSMVGLSTDQIGQFYSSITNLLYTNIYFQWAGESFPGAGLNEVISDSMTIPRRKAVMYQRQGIGMSPPIIKGYRLVENDNDKQYIWFIRDILTRGNYTIMTVSEDA